MYRAKVDCVRGIKVQANGKWLTCIGNIPIKAGDYVWTDGRCIYGNLLEAGDSSFVPTETKKGIPIVFGSRPRYFEYFDKKPSTTNVFVAHNFEKIFFLNTKNKCKLFNLDDLGEDFQGSIIDAEINNTGEIYVLEGCSVKNDKIIGGRIFKNGKAIGSYVEQLEMAFTQAQTGKYPRYRLFNIISGFIDENGEYHIYAEIRCASFNTSIGDDNDTLYADKYDDQFIIISSKKIYTFIHSGVYFNQYGDTTDNFYEIAPDHSVKIPMNDGWYFTFAVPSWLRNIRGARVKYFDLETDYFLFSEPGGTPNRADSEHAEPHPIIFPSTSFISTGTFTPTEEPYKVKIYDNNNNLKLQLDYIYEMPLKIHVCHVRDNKFLLYPYAAEGKNIFHNERLLLLVSVDNEKKIKIISEVKRNGVPENIHSSPINYRFRAIDEIKKIKLCRNYKK